MERMWRRLGHGLGKYWWAVLGGVVVITAALSFGAIQIEFATGQDVFLETAARSVLAGLTAP
jgi:hypothetical protein